jgi:type VI secretion system secreted protein Hcp
MTPADAAFARTLVAAALLASGLAQANDILLKFENDAPPIPGYSTINGYKGQIEASSFQWGLGVGIDRSGGRATVSPASLSEITWTQQFDPGYTALSQALVTGSDEYKSTFSFLRVNGNTVEPYLTMTTEQAAIGSLSFSSGGGAPSVSASQAFRKFELGYTPFDGSKNSAPLKVSYNTADPKSTTVTPINATPAGGSLTGSSRGSAGLYLLLGNGMAGESTVRGYENWIELSSAQMGMGIGLSPDPGGGFTTSIPSLSELTVTQVFDRSVIGAVGALLKGSMIDEARLELVQDTAAGAVTTMQLKLKDVLFSGLSLSSGGDLPQVSESLNFASYTQTIWEVLPDGRRGGASVFTYDAIQNKSSYSSVAQAQGVNVPQFGAGMIEPPPEVSPIPEPQAWAMMSGGIALLLMVRRRRQA